MNRILNNKLIHDFLHSDVTDKLIFITLILLIILSIYRYSQGQPPFFVDKEQQPIVEESTDYLYDW